MERYALESGQVTLFRQARNLFNDLLNRSYSNVALREKFFDYLDSPGTLKLKGLIPSDELNDFNVFSFIDTVSIKFKKEC